MEKKTKAARVTLYRSCVDTETGRLISWDLTREDAEASVAEARYYVDGNFPEETEEAYAARAEADPDAESAVLAYGIREVTFELTAAGVLALLRAETPLFMSAEERDENGEETAGVVDRTERELGEARETDRVGSTFRVFAGAPGIGHWDYLVTRIEDGIAYGVQTFSNVRILSPEETR